MNKSTLFLIGILFLGFTACNNAEQEKSTDMADPTQVVQVLDFHSTHRCLTCNTIEEKTRATLEAFYKDEVEKGLITFQTINVDEEENAAIAQEFEAFGTALFINVVKEGESSKVDLTEFAFMNAMNEDASFQDGLKVELNKALEQL